jgi:hypothetical protein
MTHRYARRTVRETIDRRTEAATKRIMKRRGEKQVELKMKAVRLSLALGSPIHDDPRGAIEQATSAEREQVAYAAETRRLIRSEARRSLLRGTRR